VDLVFRLRQLRERVLRVRALLDCLLDDTQHVATARLLSHLASVGQEQRSVGALISSNSSLLAAKVAERSSETGEHYITRTRAEYRAMLGNAAGGGALTALTTAMKFGIMALGLSAFWYGFWSGVMYAASFVLIQMLHFTLATKQPAMTAPAMAAKLKDISDSQALQAFVDEVTHLVRSQVAAIIGNVAVVFPAAVLLSAALLLATGAPMITPEKADCFQAASLRAGWKTGLCCTGWTRLSATTRASQPGWAPRVPTGGRTSCGITSRDLPPTSRWA
jgi:site-specific recombinase